MPDTEPPQAGPHPAALAALRQILRPLVRFLLDHRITLPLLTPLLKELYVDVAERELPIEGRAQTATRLSLLTGVHRKDVRRIREAPRHRSTSGGQAPLGAQIVARWTADPRYLDPEGRPRALSRGRIPGAPSFDELVASVSTDLRSRTVLDEWLRLGVAHLDEEGQVRLEVDAFVPESGFDEKAYFFGRNTRDHLETAVANLRGDGPTSPDRAVYYGALRRESTEELAQLAERLGMEALQAVNRRARELKARDAAAGDEADQRFTLGFYVTRGTTTPEDEAPSASGEASGGGKDDA